MYQTMNPDNLASSSVRKCNHLKLSKEEQNCPGNGRITSSSTSSTTTTVTNSQQQNNHQQDHHNHDLNHQIGIHLSNTNHIQNQNQTHESSNILSNSGSGDVLLQWGQRKRSRWCSRTEGRSMSSSEKHQNHIMPPPSQPSTSSNNNGGGGSCRSGGSTRVRPNGLLYPKDGSGFLPTKNRNLGDQNQMGCTNSASPSKNGGAGNSSRAISRSSVGKRSPSCIEKKISSGSGSIRKVKSDDSLPHTSNGNHHMESNHGEHHENGGGHITTTTVRSPLTEPDKGNGEVVEWPRIYISLSRKEKEDDFYAMKGTKLPHRPKKRAKAVDRALQYCFPGLWLSDLTRARYEVRERKSTKKPKRRGLKGLESMESESE